MRGHRLCVAQTSAVLLLALIGCQGRISVQDASSTKPSEKPGVMAPDAPPGKEPAQMPPLVPTTCTSSSAPAGARLLTNEEFAWAVADVLGVTLEPNPLEARQPDRANDGFFNTSNALHVTPQRFVGYLDAAFAAVELLGPMQPFIARYSGCAEPGPDCAEKFVRSLGAKLWRRALTDDEVAPIVGLFTAEKSLEEGAQEATVALLISPEFIYRLEGPDQLTSTQVATRLASLVWSAVPDAELIEAIEAGAFNEPERAEALLDEMLDDPRARRSFNRFLTDWLQLRVLDSLEIKGVLASSMEAETLALFEDVAWTQRRDLMEVFVSQKTTVSTKQLAQLYGFSEAGRLDLSMSPRVGLLGHASIQAVSGNEGHEMMIYRGLYLLKTFFCRTVPEPTAELLAQAPQIFNESQSAREQSEARLAAGSCTGCHSAFEPLAYGMEAFDEQGRFSEADAEGRAYTSAGQLRLDGTRHSFESLHEVASLLSQSSEIQQCIARKATQYAWGRTIDVSADQCALDEINSQFKARGRTWQGLIKSIALHPSFLAYAEVVKEETL